MGDDGTEFTIDLDVKGAAGATAAATAVAQLAERLETARAATEAAKAAMQAQQGVYNQAEANANRAALAVEKIGAAADAQRGKLAAALDAGDGAGAARAEARLAALTQRQGEAVAKAQATAAAMNAEAASLDRLKAAAATAAAAETKLAKEHDKAKEASKEATKVAKDAAKAADTPTNFRALSAGLGNLGGPLGSAGQQAAAFGGALQKLSKALGAAGPYVAAAVLAVALAAAFAVATIAILKFGIAQADAARSQGLLDAGIARSVAGGEVLGAQLDDLATKVPISREDLSGMAKGLADGGLRGTELATALEAAAVKAATLKFGPEFRKEMLSLPSQAARLKTNFSSLFSGLKIDALLEGLSRLVRLFDANEASGKAIKVVFESMFQPLVDGLTNLIPKATTTFLKLEVLALQAMIAIKPYGSQLKLIGEAFLILGALAVAAVALVIGVLVAVVAQVALFVAGLLWLSGVFTDLGSAIVTGAGGALDWLIGKFNEVVAFLKGLSFSEIGASLIEGLIAGITGAGAGVLTAVTNLASGAAAAAKAALRINSPSKVFADIGASTGEGMVDGVDGSAKDVNASLTDLVTPSPKVAAAAGGASASGSSSSSGDGMIINLTVNANGGDGPSIATAVREALSDLFKQAGRGTPVPVT